MRKKRPVRPLAAVVFLVGLNGIFGWSIAAEHTPKIKLVAQEFPAGTAEIQVLPASVQVSPNLKRVALVARHDDSYLAVVDGVEGKDYDGIGRNSLAFSPDSKHCVYAAKQDNNWLVVQDGEEGKACESLRRISFSPDSQHLAYAANHGRNWAVSVDGVESGQYDEIGDIVFSPVGRRVAYTANRGNSWLVVAGGVEGKEYDGIAQGSLVFSPDGQHVAYGACRGRNWFAVLDGVEGKAYDALGKNFSLNGRTLVAYGVLQADLQPDALANNEENDNAAFGVGECGPIFSPDSKRLAYWAQRGHKWLIIVDGVESKKYDGFLQGSNLRFSSPTSLRAVAIQGDNAVRVEIEVREEP